MAVGKKIDIQAVKVAEKSLLLSICDGLENLLKGPPNFKEPVFSEDYDFGAVHGTMREAYNSFGGLLQSPRLAELQSKLIGEQAEKIYDARDILVRGVEVEGMKFEDAARANGTAEVVKEVVDTLTGYISEWYRD